MAETLIFSCKIDAQKLFSAFTQIPLLAAGQLRAALNTSLRAVQVDSKLHHEFKSHGHKLENSVQYKTAPDGLSAEIWLENDVAPYAAAVHNGSRSHRIYPNVKKSLHFVIGGKEFFRGKGGTIYVNHPGYKGDPFLFNAFKRQWPFTLAHIKGAVAEIFQMAGIK